LLITSSKQPIEGVAFQLILSLRETLLFSDKKNWRELYGMDFGKTLSLLQKHAEFQAAQTAVDAQNSRQSAL
jgi:hypothetical protein